MKRIILSLGVGFLIQSYPAWALNSNYGGSAGSSGGGAGTVTNVNNNDGNITVTNGAGPTVTENFSNSLNVTTETVNILKTTGTLTVGLSTPIAPNVQAEFDAPQSSPIIIAAPDNLVTFSNGFNSPALRQMAKYGTSGSILNSWVDQYVTYVGGGSQDNTELRWVNSKGTQLMALAGGNGAFYLNVYEPIVDTQTATFGNVVVTGGVASNAANTAYGTNYQYVFGDTSTGTTQLWCTEYQFGYGASSYTKQFSMVCSSNDTGIAYNITPVGLSYSTSQTNGMPSFLISTGGVSIAGSTITIGNGAGGSITQVAFSSTPASGTYLMYDVVANGIHRLMPGNTFSAGAGAGFSNPVSSLTSIGAILTTSTLNSGVHTVSATITSGNLLVISTFGTVPINNYELDVTSFNANLSSGVNFNSPKFSVGTNPNGFAKLNVDFGAVNVTANKATTYTLFTHTGSDNYGDMYSDNGNEELVWGVPSGGSGQIGMSTNQGMDIITNNSVRAHWLNTGQMGQGTTTPDAPLSVFAAAGTSGLIMDVSTGTAGVSSGHLFEVNGTSVVFYVPIFDGTTGITVPDYVFDVDHELMEMTDLRLYVQAEKHLPGVWSETEFNDHHNKNGIESNFTYEMQTMEKVEEAYLYIFQQQDEIDSLKQQIADLKKQVDAVPNQIAGLEQEIQGLIHK